jgi:hypothetical protein
MHLGMGCHDHWVLVDEKFQYTSIGWAFPIAYTCGVHFYVGLVFCKAHEMHQWDKHLTSFTDA